MQYSEQVAYLAADQGRLFRKSVEWLLTAAIALLGFYITAYGLVSNHDLYLPMTIVAPSYVWGAGMMAVGVLRAAVLIVNGYWPHSYLARKWLSVCALFVGWLPIAACFWWGYIVSLMEIGGKFYPGTGLSFVCAGAEFLVFYSNATFVYIGHRRNNG